MQHDCKNENLTKGRGRNQEARPGKLYQYPRPAALGEAEEDPLGESWQELFYQYGRS